MRFYVAETREIVEVTMYDFYKEDEWGNEVYDRYAEDMMPAHYTEEEAGRCNPYESDYIGAYVMTKAEFDYFVEFWSEEVRRMRCGEPSQIDDEEGYVGEDYDCFRKVEFYTDVVGVYDDDDVDEVDKWVYDALARYGKTIKKA